MCGASVVVWCRVEPSIGTSTKHTPIQWIIERERESERERERRGWCSAVVWCAIRYHLIYLAAVLCGRVSIHLIAYLCVYVCMARWSPSVGCIYMLLRAGKPSKKEGRKEYLTPPAGRKHPRILTLEYPATPLDSYSPSDMYSLQCNTHDTTTLGCTAS